MTTTNDHVFLDRHRRPPGRSRRDRRARRRRHLRAAHRPGRQEARRPDRCACSPTTARSPDRRCGSARAPRSSSGSATTATPRRPSTGTGCASTTATTAYPDETQAPIPVGGEFTYRLRFPDDGLYWYHPHVREDYGLEMGLYGNILVDPADDATGRRSTASSSSTLDDILIEDGQIAPFRPRARPTRRWAASATSCSPSARPTSSSSAAPARSCASTSTNTANTRIFNVSDPWRPHEARRRRQRPLRARGVRR